MREPHPERPTIDLITEAIMPVAQKAVVTTVSPSALVIRHALLFAAAALFVYLLSLTDGLDLSPGFF
jgi:hypothetical protein